MPFIFSTKAVLSCMDQKDFLTVGALVNHNHQLLLVGMQCTSECGRSRLGVGMYALTSSANYPGCTYYVWSEPTRSANHAIC